MLVLLSGFGKRLLSEQLLREPIYETLNSLFESIKAHVKDFCLATYENKDQMNTLTLLNCMNELYTNGNFSCSYSSRKSL